MTKFWMTAMVAILFGLTTGCPDEGDDADADCIPACAPGYVCLYGDCVPEGSDTDADADSDTSEDDADTSEAADCPNIAGEWASTWHNGSVTVDRVITLEQNECSLTGWDDDGAEYSGTIYEDGSLSLRRIYGTVRTLTGGLTAPSRLEGNWVSDTGESGTWWADRQ